MAFEKQVNPFGKLASTSQMVQATLNFNWSQTELGPIENWDFGLINSLRIVFNCPVGMYCTWGPERRVFYNDAYTPILKHRHPWALGSPLRSVWPEVWDQVDAIASKVEAGGVVLESDVQFDIVVDGRPQENYYTYGNSPLFNADGKISGMLCTILDTTTSVLRTHAALRSAKEAAEHASRAKSAFLANMSHEIRTPLGVILGFSEILGSQDDMEPAEREKYLDVILRNGSTLTRIIDDILDLSKIEAGKFATEMSSVNLKNLAQEVRAMFTDQASSKSIDLNFDLAGIDDLIVLTDAIRVRQVLVNLIGNAVKFTTEGFVKVSARAEQENGTEQKITFTIEDTGIGMTPEQAERLFQPFTQADVTSTRRFGGTGLGLALSKNLASALGGDVRIANCEENKGSTFEFTFRADIASQTSQVATAETDCLNVPVDLKGFRVLAVDDSPDNRELISTVLHGANLEVNVVPSGEEALNETANHHYDLILMDIQMPGLDGFSTLTELRKHGFQGPVVALTAHAMKEDRDRTLAAGFAEHLTKPINSKMLLKTLQSFLNHGR
ncbi:response regulator [Bdellovibrio sp. KM01]|uniref:response regulator n=1 Tax=Bdellovibrio sp. KM01 TaxID=2748865 RepID=UPI0021059765|nr:response regulator [Bdellovibrio sp. KM01]